MPLNSELKEIREMLRRIIKDLTKIRQAQKQMKEEMYEVKDDLKKFKELWRKEKSEMESRLQKLEEVKAKEELLQRLARFERMGEAIELKEKKSDSNINGWQVPRSCSLQENEIGRRIEELALRDRMNFGSTVSIKYKKLRASEKSPKIARAGPRFIKNLFASAKTDL